MPVYNFLASLSGGEGRGGGGIQVAALVQLMYNMPSHLKELVVTAVAVIFGASTLMHVRASE